MKRERLENSGFARLYLWTTKAKHTMGIFFVVFVVFFLLLGLISEGPAVTLNFVTAIEMVFASFFIGLVQQAVLPVEKLSRGRCMLWIVSGVLITLAFSLAFGWFVALPPWCLLTFLLITALAMLAMILSYYLELRHMTRRLNRGLEQFQKRDTKKET